MSCCVLLSVMVSFVGSSLCHQVFGHLLTLHCFHSATMCPVLLLLVAALTSGNFFTRKSLSVFFLSQLLESPPFPECTSSPRGGSTGLEYIVAFPENIAYYHPDEGQNQIRITALYNNTVVTITSRQVLLETLRLQAGDVHSFKPRANLELKRLEVDDRTLLISSSSAISAHLVSLKSQSLQTTLLISSDRLSSQYRLPPVPPIQGTSRPVAQVTRQVTERSPFRLLVVNTGHVNQVKVTGGSPQSILLQPYEVAQVWLQEEEPTPAVTAQQQVALFFGHACSVWHNCSCGLLFSAVAPPTDREETFYVPSFLSQSAANQSLVLLSDSPAPQVRTLSPASPALTSAGPALLFWPGLLLPLIPESEFAACFLVDSVPDSNNYAVIVVRENQVGGVHLGGVAVNTSRWQRLHGTDFVSTHVDLKANQTVVWHDSSRMAVYLVGDKDGVWFGNPAAAISATPGTLTLTLTLTSTLSSLVRCGRSFSSTKAKI